MALDAAHQNPPRPPGVRPWKGKVPADISKWAVEVINSPTEYPMHSENVQFLDNKLALIRVEWHDWSTKGQHKDQTGDPNAKISGLFRGATLYEVVDPQAWGEHYYNTHPEQFNMSVSGGAFRMARHHFGAAPVVAPKPAQHTVTGHVAAAVDFAAKPIRWAFSSTGSAVKWLGGTLQSIGNKL